MKDLSQLVLIVLILVSPAFAADAAGSDYDPTTKPARLPGPEFGNSLELMNSGLGPMMDVAAEGSYLYAVGEGRLFVLDSAQKDAPAPRVLSKLDGLGHVRQVAVQHGFALITSREDGLYVVDARRPEHPVLASHYDTIELATGIAVSGQVAAVANRFAGVELIDISNPSLPRHLATVRVGEAQSVVFKGNYLYAGVWGSNEVAVVDVSDPRKPELIATAPLDGHGDGVAVRGNLLLAATGHHSRAKPADKPGDPGFGRGHGLEIFDISNPAKPRFISRLKFPPLYRLGMDMWGVEAAGDIAFVHDTYNGLFVIDIRDPARPCCVAHCQLPVVKAQNDPSPLAGLALAGGRVFLAGAWSDLHVVTPDEPTTPSPESGAGLTIPVGPRPAEQVGRVYKPEGQVHAALPWRGDAQGTLVLVAAGKAGLHVVRLGTGAQFECLNQYPTKGFATDLAYYGDRVYVAENTEGLSAWEADATGKLTRRGVYVVPGESIRQVVLADQGRVAFLAVGASRFQAIRLSDDNSFTKLFEDSHPGLFYKFPISPVAAGDRTVLCQWHVSGLYEYEAENGAVKFTGHCYPGRMGTDCGSAAFADKWLATSRAGYVMMAGHNTRILEMLGRGRIEGENLSGKPTVYDRTLFIAHPFNGAVKAIDITESCKPRILARIQLAEHPGFVRLLGDLALVPAGYEGLIAWNWRGSGTEK